MSARIYIEGGGESKELHARCREGFRRLIERCGFEGRMPKLVACGSRRATFKDFSTAHRHRSREEYVALLVDSEKPVADIEKTWNHLKSSDGWDRPESAADDQALLMTTCMETWIAADREALRNHYGSRLRPGDLPNEVALESRSRLDIQKALHRATQDCSGAYAKGKRSFEIIAKLNPATLRRSLPSFARFERVLKANLRRRTPLAPEPMAKKARR